MKWLSIKNLERRKAEICVCLGWIWRRYWNVLENMMKVNGEEKTLEKELSLQEFLLQEGYIKEQIAVERNGEIVPKAQFEQVMLSDGDVLEIVHFVGGGC